MPALAIPIGAPFEVAPDKVAEFLEFSRKMNSREITESGLKNCKNDDVEWNEMTSSPASSGGFLKGLWRPQENRGGGFCFIDNRSAQCVLSLTSSPQT